MRHKKKIERKAKFMQVAKQLMFSKSPALAEETLEL